MTEETKEATRQAILEASETLLREHGWENVSTRDIASAAGIANGTLFNYFATKEAIAAELVANTLANANRAELRGSAEEQVFGLIAAGLRRLRPLRPYLPQSLDAILRDADRLRDEHIARVEPILGRELTPVLRHLYWTLYTGVITFWVADASHRQEQTLALADRSVKLFLASLDTGGES